MRKAVRRAAKATKRRPSARALSLSGGPLRLVRMVRAGLPFSSLLALERASGLPRETLARFVGIPQRTLTRRQTAGRLPPDESDRVLRAARVLERTIELFEGDVAAARQWLLTPQPALGRETPLDFASTDVGAREVERLIGRLEHGVSA